MKEISTKDFVHQLETTIHKKSITLKDDLEVLKEYFEQYQGIITKLISSKKTYAQLIKKYASPNSLPVTRSLPGINMSLPQLTSYEGMKQDKEQLDSLAKEINILENQKITLKSALFSYIDSLIKNLNLVNDSSDQINDLLNNAIDTISNGVYGSPYL